MTPDAALTFPSSAAPARRASWLDRVAREAVMARLGGLSGALTIVENGVRIRAGSGEGGPTVRVGDPSFWSAVAFRGSVGAGESYAEGSWHCDDLPGLVRLLLREEVAGQSLDGGLARLAAPALRFVHSRRRNTREGSRRNIASHYDLGTDCFALLLDESLTYSCGIYETADATLAEAQRTKIERLCRKLRLQPGHHVLEIGTGWGALAMHAARHHGCRVTTTTISRAQHEAATERIARAGLADRITVLLEDYRDLRGTFDRLVSVEMIEAVGHDGLPGFFRTCAGRLERDGVMALQAITIADHAYERHRRSIDFIKAHVFPGSNIPSLAAMTAAAAGASDLRVLHLEDIGPHYATTLAAWRANLHANVAELERLGWTRSRLRGFDFYFAYCEGGFAERYLGDVQIVMARPGFRGESLLGSLEGAAR